MKIPAPLLKCLDKVGHEFEAAAAKLLRTKELLAKSNEDLLVLSEGKYTNGIRAFKSPIHHVELVSVWKAVEYAEFNLSFPSGLELKILRAASRREAKRMFHFAFSHRLKSIDEEAL